MNVRGEECPGTPPHGLCARLPESMAAAWEADGAANCTRSPYFLNKLFIFLEENR